MTGGRTGKNLLPILCAAALCGSCGSLGVKRQSVPAPVYWYGRAPYRLLPPDRIEKPIDMAQQIAGVYGETAFLADALVVATEQSLTVILYDALGIELAALSFDGTTAAFESAFFPALKGEYLAADFQLVFYAVKDLEAALSAAGLGFEVYRGEGAVEKRTVKWNNEIIIEITKTPDAIHYVNHPRNYRYTLRGAFE